MTISTLNFRISHPRVTTLFPYTTLFRSHPDLQSKISAVLNHDVGTQYISSIRMLPYQRSDMERVFGPVMKLNRSEEHTSELQSQSKLVCRLLLEEKIQRGDRHHQHEDAE